MGLRKISSEVDCGKEGRESGEGQSWFERRRDEGENSPLLRFESCADVEEADRVDRVLPSSLKIVKSRGRMISHC